VYPHLALGQTEGASIWRYDDSTRNAFRQV